MAISKIRVTVPLSAEETFRRLSDHAKLKDIVDQVTTSALIKESNKSFDINGLGSIRQVTFNGDLLTEKVTAWFPPSDSETTELADGSGSELGYDYRVIAGKRLIADHLGVVRIARAGAGSSHISWDIHLKVPIWATGEIAAYFVCRSMEKKITESIIKNLN